MLRIAILDDLQEHVRTLGAMIERTLEGKAYQLARFTDTEVFLSEIREQARFDIVFLDINLGDVDGVTIAREVNRVAPLAQVIYISAYLDYVKQVYETRHLYFLAKPVEEASLKKALARAIAAVNALQDGKVALPMSARSGGGVRVFGLFEIVYCEREGRKTLVYTRSGQTYTTPLSIKNILALLPQDRFFSPHASFLLSLGYVRAFTQNSASLEGGYAVPVSTHRKAAFLTALENHML